MEQCQFPNGIVIKPDGVHELDPCVYQAIERYRNVTIEVRRCIHCGKIDIVWTRQEDTEEEEIE